MKIAVIGGGISGVVVARLLASRHDVALYEAKPHLGGLIHCRDTAAGLYHQVGGHVFNTKSSRVAAWFWQHFDRDREFHTIHRDAKILLDSREVDYPIEDHLYQLDAALRRQIVTELVGVGHSENPTIPNNLKDFLLSTFGTTLCQLYFFPYNQKIWGERLDAIPLDWLEGKLPMPKPTEILLNNVNRTREAAMVHATFYYPKRGGSQYIIDQLAKPLNIRLSSPVTTLCRQQGKWHLGGLGEKFDRVIYCGDVRRLPTIWASLNEHPQAWRARALRTRGIRNILCTCERTTASWLYLPERRFAANRIIYTGCFSQANNYGSRQTCVVEFNDATPLATALNDIRCLPGDLEVVEHNIAEDAYVIQEQDTRVVVENIRTQCEEAGLYLLGRFAEWEYYNMDKCMEAAFRLSDRLDASDKD